MLETNSHFAPELLIFALGDITISNLAYTSHLLGLEHPTVFGRYENFFYFFIFVLGSEFACVRLLPFMLCYIISTSCCPSFWELAEQPIISLVGCSKGIRLARSVEQ